MFYNLLEDGNKSYYVKYYAHGKQYKKKIGKHSEGIREGFCFKKRSDYINEARLGMVSHSKKYFDQVTKEYHNTKMTNATYKEMKSRYEHIIKPFFNTILLSKITQNDIYSFQQHLLETVVNKEGKCMSDATVNYYVTQVSSILRYAVSKGYLNGNVARNVKALKEDNTRDRYLEKNELDVLVDAVMHDEDLLLFVEMSMSTGGRMSAVMSVCKKDINLKNKSVSIRDEKGKEYYTAFLNERVMGLIRLGESKPNDRIYTSNVRRMQRQMKKVLDVLFNEGLDVSDSKNRVVIHTLRHTFASHLAINGTPIFTIQKLLNHKDIKQTMRYAKLSPDSGREDVNSIW